MNLKNSGKMEVYVKRSLGLLFCALFLANIVYANATVLDESQKRLISLDFPDTPLSTVISVLSLKTGYKFITDSDLAKRRIVLSLKEVTPEEAINALLDTYNLYYVRQGETNIYVIKSKTDTVVTTVSKVFFLNFPTAKELEPVLKTKLSKNGTISSAEKSNAIIVNDTANNIDEIDQLIKALDVPPLQVLLEAKIIDVKIDNHTQIGVDTTLYRTNQTYTSPLSLTSSLQGSAATTVTSAQPQVGYTQSFSPGFLNAGTPGSGLRVALLSGDMNVQAYIEALQTDTNAKILTNPRLVVINNKEATINIIEEVPYASQSTTGIGTGIVSSVVAFKEVGIKLKVRPQINRDGTIILDISPEQSSIVSIASDGTPTVYTSKTDTTFMMENGETAVIGGLVKEEDTNTEYKVPLLGDIPILGNLFKRSDKEKIRTELTVIITAKILK